MSPIFLIGCSIMRRQTERVIEESGLDNLEIIWLTLALHDNIENLESSLEEAVSEIRAKYPQAPAGLLYGWACLPTMAQFAAERGLKYLPVKNCLAALVGDGPLKALEQHRTMAASTAWVRDMWLGRRHDPLGWTADDYRMQFGRYDRIVVLEDPLAPLSDEEIIECFDLVQVPLETQSCSSDCFRQTILDFIRSLAAEASRS